MSKPHGKGKGRANIQASSEDLAIGHAHTPRSHVSDGSGSIFARTVTSAWKLTQNVVHATSGTLVEGDLALLRDGIGKTGESSRPFDSGSLAHSASASSTHSSMQGSSSSCRDLNTEHGFRPSETDVEYEFFLASLSAHGRKEDHHKWISDETHPTISDKSLDVLEARQQDGADVLSLLCDSQFSSMIDSSDHVTDAEEPMIVPADLFTRGVPSCALSVLEELKKSLPSPPVHHPFSSTSRLNLQPSFFTPSFGFSNELSSDMSENDQTHKEQVCSPSFSKPPPSSLSLTKLTSL